MYSSSQDRDTHLLLAKNIHWQNLAEFRRNRITLYDLNLRETIMQFIERIHSLLWPVEQIITVQHSWARTYSTVWDQVCLLGAPVLLDCVTHFTQTIIITFTLFSVQNDAVGWSQKTTSIAFWCFKKWFHNCSSIVYLWLFELSC